MAPAAPTYSTLAYALTTVDSTLTDSATARTAPAATTNTATAAAATAADPVLFPFQAAYTLVSKGFLGYTSGALAAGETGAPAAGTITAYGLLAAPFVAFNAPIEAFTGQSIVLPDGGKLTPSVANLVVAERDALSAFAGLPSQLSTVVSSLVAQAQATYSTNVLASLTGLSKALAA